MAACGRRRYADRAPLGRLAAVVTPAARGLLCAFCLAALGLVGCGSSPPKVVGRVQLTITAPADGAIVRDQEVTVRGRVSPAGATVLVEGRSVSRSGAAFTASVPVGDGTTLIDVLAEAPRRTPAVAALRVRRPVTVVIPQLADAPPAEAEQRLKELGLRPETKDTGDLLDDLFGGRVRVCKTKPDAGSTVDVGSSVVVEVARSC